MNDLAKSWIRIFPLEFLWLRHFLGWLVSVFRSREDLVLENLALRRQLLALHAQQPHRRLTALRELFWVALRGHTHYERVACVTHPIKPNVSEIAVQVHFKRTHSP
jgi:hypothetical protein